MCGHCGLILVFGTEVDVDKFGVRLSRGEETGGNCKENHVSERGLLCYRDWCMHNKVGCRVEGQLDFVDCERNE